MCYQNCPMENREGECTIAQGPFPCDPETWEDFEDEERMKNDQN